MSKEFTPGCDHHLQMLTAPTRTSVLRPKEDLLYSFGCKRCPGKIIIRTREMRGKTIEGLFEEVLARCG